MTRLKKTGDCRSVEKIQIEMEGGIMIIHYLGELVLR